MLNKIVKNSGIIRIIKQKEFPINKRINRIFVNLLINSKINALIIWISHTGINWILAYFYYYGNYEL